MSAACTTRPPQTARSSISPPSTARHVLRARPSVNELYGRVDGEHTVPISEPALPRADCTGVCETDENTQADRSEGVFEGASRDGAKVFFLTEQPLLNADKDTTTDLYMAEVEGVGPQAHIGRLVMVSQGEKTDPHRGEGADVQGISRISENGERVYFVASGVLTTKPDPSLPAGRQTAVQGEPNLYAFDTATEKIAFVVTLSAVDSADSGVEDLRPMQATEDGECLVFQSSADLTTGDTSTAPQLFEYDAASEQLARVSIGQEGFNEDGNVDDSAYAPAISSPQYESSRLGDGGGAGPGRCTRRRGVLRKRRRTDRRSTEQGYRGHGLYRKTCVRPERL